MVADIVPAAFTTAVSDVTDAISGPLATGLVGIAVAALGVSLAVGWIKRIRSAV